MKTEVEAKFWSADASPLDRLTQRPRLGDATLGVPMTFAEVDRYLDTDDGRLAAARWACRLRTREGATRLSLKGPPTEPPGGAGIGPTGGWRHERPEVEGPATPSIAPEEWPGSPALDLLDRLREGGPLRELLRFDQQRTERDVVLASAGRIGTLTLDRVAMSAADRDLGSLHVVELELDDASAERRAALDALAEALAEEPGLHPEPRSKLEHALERMATLR